MKQITAHQVKPNITLPELQSAVVRNIDAEIDQLKMPAPRVLWTKAIHALSIGEAQLAHRFLEVWVQTEAADFARLGREHAFDLEIRGRRVPVQPNPTWRLAEGAHDWIHGFSLAVAARDQTAIDMLLAHDRSKLERVNFEQEACNLSLAETFRYFYLKDDRWQAELADFLRLSEAKELKIASPRDMVPTRALAPIFESIAAQDQEGFTETLVAHLEAFKAYWSRTPTLDSQLSVPAIGLCAMAVQRGLELQVESGYIPDWLVHGVSPG